MGVSRQTAFSEGDRRSSESLAATHIREQHTKLQSLVTGLTALVSRPGYPVHIDELERRFSKEHPMNTQYLDRDEGRVAYDVAGAGPLVICVPSMGDVRAEYRFLAPALAQAGYTVAAMDQRGMGETSARWSDYTAAGVGSDIVALARHLNAGPAVVIGDSSGGGAAVWAAAEAPDAIGGIVLADAFVRAVPSLKNSIFNVLSRLLFVGPWGAGVWVSYYGSLYPTRPPADFEDYKAALRRDLQEPGRLAALRGQLFAPKTASETRVARVRVPALVLFGTRDPDFADPEAEARWIAGQVRGEVRMLEGAGHYPHAEMPAETLSLVLPFLRTVFADAPHGA
jgi:pimeloyl-ACP methyl ester carboxylesterase